MQVPFLDLSIQYKNHKSEIDSAIQRVLDSGQFIGGREIDEFEAKFAEYYKINSCIGVGNGAMAIEIVLRALGIGMGDEVITTSYSWIASAHAISMTGAQPVFIDIQPDTFNIDIDKIEKHISSKTKAILPVHLYGKMVDMPRIKELADRYKLWIIEDAAQAHGASFHGILPGQLSKAAIFSFYPTKQMGAYGDAGAIITNDELFAEKCRRMANHGALFPKRDFEFTGSNSRMDPIQAAILNVKLKYLNTWVERRRWIAERYAENLKDCTAIELPVFSHGDSWYMYSIKSINRNQLIEFLSENGIGASINYQYILPYTAPYYESEKYPNSEHASQNILNLPIYPELTEQQIDYVCTMIKTFHS